MSNDLALSLLFCENHPSDAASLLVRLPPEYVAAFLRSLSPVQCINLIQHMPTAYTTQLLTYFEKDFSARLLCEANFSTATRLLRPFNAQQRVELMACMDAAQSAQLRRMLNFSPGSVGNLVEIPTLTALGDWTVKHAQRELKKIRRHSLFDFPVVDDEHRFLGLVTIHALLIAAENSRLDELCTGKDLALPAYATVASVLNHPLWERRLSLPVVDRGGILMGVLYHTGLKAHVPTLPGAHAQDVLAPVMALAELYWAASSSIIDTIGRKKPSRPKRT
ncbi:MAG: CBS domain-containing protein [Gammaproteobacteria bacterium]|jgi:magnesium transporter